MARANALNAETLASVGVKRLATLLIDLAEDDPALRKRLVLVVAEAGGRDAMVKAIDRRLSALTKSRSFIAWEKSRSYSVELDGLRAAIAEGLTPVDSVAAAERLLILIRTAPKIFDRVDDSGGRFADVFRTAVEDLAKAWEGVSQDHEAMAEDVFALVRDDDYGVCDDLVASAATALRAAGLAALATRARAALALEPTHAHERPTWAILKLQRMLRDIADADGDVDAFIAVEAQAGGGKVDVTGIAQRLLKAGRAGEALQWLTDKHRRARSRLVRYTELIDAPYGGGVGVLEWERETLKIQALTALKRVDEAQTIRWNLFESTLDPDILREYLKLLPDFEDAEALDRAFAVASNHPDIGRLLTFYLRWPNLRVAASLVLERLGDLDGREYLLLDQAAEALEHSYPLAATLLHRRMIDSVLERAASSAYPHAMRNLTTCESLSKSIDWASLSQLSHDAYVGSLRANHARKRGFWALVDAA